MLPAAERGKKDMEHSRIVYLDVLESIAIFLVVFCHFPQLSTSALGNILMLASYVAVPLFFMVNGVLLFERPFSAKKHLHRILSILVQFLAWKLITLSLFSLLHIVDLSAFSKPVILQYFLGGALPGVFTDHLWFLVALVSCYLLFPLLKSCYDTEDGKKRIVYTTALCFFFFFVINDANFLLQMFPAWTGLPQTDIFILKMFSPIAGYGFALFFFLLGPLLHRALYVEQKPIPHLTLYALVAFAVGLLVLLFQNYIQNGTMQWTGVYFEDGYQRIGTVLMAAALFVLSTRVRVYGKWVEQASQFVSARTLPVFFIHMILASLLYRYWFVYSPIKGVLANLLRTFAIVAASIVIGDIMRKIPFLKRIV